MNQSPDDTTDGDQDSQMHKPAVQVDGPSVSLKIFMDFTTSLADKFKDVIKRLIQAFGIDTSNENVRVESSETVAFRYFCLQPRSHIPPSEDT